MRPLPRPRPVHVGAALVILGMGAVGFVPLFDGPGYESSLAAGLLLPCVIAIVVALDASRECRMPLAALTRGLAVGGTFALLAYATTLAHGVARGFCDVVGGSAQFALGPGAGALMAGAYGALVGEIAWRLRRPRAIAIVLGAAGPLVSILISVGRFYTSPMIFAYDPFVGYFSGTLYDTLIDSTGLQSYRVASAATLVAALAFAAHLARDERGRLILRRPLNIPVLAAGLLGLAGSVASLIYGPRLGHYQTSGTIAAKLGGHIDGARCRVVYPRSLRRADLERFTNDCDAHVTVLERWFGALGPRTITVFVFESAAQKGALMGAADTFIAKPWRREVYVQAAAYPHPVIGHELAHVIAGAYGRGPFRVAGSVFGLLPNPGLIEGVAVAAEPREGDLTPAEWAKAMKDLNLLPPLSRLFTLGFLGENAGVAYTVSGAFVEWIREHYGAGALRAWYGGSDLSALAGAPWAELERRWRSDLDRIVLGEPARAQARARFDRPALFGRRCPHVVDGCKAQASRMSGAGDYLGAVRAHEEVLALDPHDDGARLGIARNRIREGALAEGEAELARLADGAATNPAIRDRASEDLGDLALADGRSEMAIARYREVMGRTLDEDQLRTLDLKVAAAAEPRFRSAIVALLIGRRGRAPDRTLGTELLGVWEATPPPDGLPLYLLGRQFVVNGQFDEARDRMDRALATPIPIERVRIEAERLRMVIACAVGDSSTAARYYEQYAAHPTVTAARRGAARALVDRCSSPSGLGLAATKGPLGSG